MKTFIDLIHNQQIHRDDKMKILIETDYYNLCEDNDGNTVIIENE